MTAVSPELMPVRPFSSLLLRRGSERVLVVADLHIGWELALAQKGIHVPSQTRKMLDKMVRLIKSHKPTSLIFLGDVKHTVATAEWGEWQDVPDFFETIGDMMQDIRVIPGNHDGNLEPLLPENVKILPSRGVVLWEDVGLFHGHTWPAPELLGCRSLVMGHVHPMVAFRDPIGFRMTRQVWVKAECEGILLAKSIFRHLNIKVGEEPADLLRDRFDVKLRSPQLLIVPSFNEFLGGQPMNRKGMGRGTRSKMFISPVLRSKGLDINKAELYLLDGTLLGSIGQLRSLS